MVLIREGVRPGLFIHGSGGGCVIADPRTIRSLVTQGLAVQSPSSQVFDRRCTAWLTRAAYALVGATPPERHPFKHGEPWP